MTTQENGDARDVALLKMVESVRQTIVTWHLAVTIGVGAGAVTFIEERLSDSLVGLGVDNLARMVVLMVAPSAAEDADRMSRAGRRGLAQLGKPDGGLPWRVGGEVRG